MFSVLNWDLGVGFFWVVSGQVSLVLHGGVVWAPTSDKRPPLLCVKSWGPFCCGVCRPTCCFVVAGLIVPRLPATGLPAWFQSCRMIWGSWARLKQKGLHFPDPCNRVQPAWARALYKVPLCSRGQDGGCWQTWAPDPSMTWTFGLHSHHASWIPALVLAPHSWISSASWCLCCPHTHHTDWSVLLPHVCACCPLPCPVPFLSDVRTYGSPTHYKIREVISVELSQKYIWSS